MNENRTVFSLFGDIVAHSTLVIGLSLAAAIITALAVLVWPATYASSASFVPENSAQPRIPTGLSGIASQLGISVGGEPSRSPSFYADLLRSRELLTTTLATKIPNPRANPDSITIYDLYRIKGRTPAVRLEDGVKALRNAITVTVDQRTDVVHLDVEARDPTAARDVARLLLRELSEFNLDTRQSIARNRRQFIEGRIAASADDLQTAEGALRSFYDRNHQWQSSPQLRFEEQRLTRQMTVQQELYLTLRREYEATRIEEVNNAPVVTVIDEPQIPGRRIRPRRLLTIIVVTLIAGLLACGLALAIERHRELLASDDPDYRRLQEKVRRLGRPPLRRTS